MHFIGRRVVSALVALVLAGPCAVFLSAQSTPWLTGYFSANNMILSPDNVAWGKYTHVIDFSASTDGSYLIPYYLKNTVETASLITDAHKNGKKILLCIKDNDNNYNLYPQATSAASVNAFVSSIVAFIEDPLNINTTN